MLLAGLVLAQAHVPFFDADLYTPVTIQRPTRISQVYYFKGSNELHGDRYRPDGDVVQVIGPESTLAQCTAWVVCDTNETELDMAGQGGHAEGFTQSRYYTYFDEELRCPQAFSVKASCDKPWAAVVGKAEEFELGDLVRMPITIARIHGSWWNRQSLVGWLWLGLLVVPVAVLAIKGLTLRQMLLALTIVTNVAFLIAKLVATVTFAAESAGAGILTFSELFPLVLAVRLLLHPGPWLAGVTLLLSFLFLALFGVGFMVGNLLLFSAALLTLAEPA